MTTRLQFSIRFLLLLMVAVAAGAAAYRVEPTPKALIAVNSLTVLYATAAIIGAVQTTGNARAFWIGTATVLTYGAAVGGMWSWQIASTQPPDVILPPMFYNPGRQLYVAWFAAPINGLFASVLHWVFSPRTDTVPLIVAAKPFSAITIRLPRATIIALAMIPLLLLLGAVFFGGMLLGELRERDRRDQEEVEFERKWTLSEETAE